jgi:virulence-associated protein VagC
MLTVTKKLFDNGGSKAVILPGDWLKKYAGLTSVLLQVSDTEIIIKPILTNETKPITEA